MSKKELKDIFTKCKLNTKHDFVDESSLGAIGLDSLDIMMLSFELSERKGSKVTLQVSTTIGDILEIA